MLIPGIKLGPQDWQQKIRDSQADFAEIWYRVDRPSDYQTMLEALRSRGVGFGFHFWGAVGGGYEANLCYPGEVGEQSYTLIEQCIITAADQGASYVNIHSGNLVKNRIDFASMSLIPDTKSPTISDDQAASNRSRALTKLGTLANHHRIRLLVETIPKKVAGGAWNDHEARMHPISIFPASLNGLLELCRSDLIGFTNDVCHTFALDRKNFAAITQTFAPYTQAVHVNTLTPPYNGTDEHLGILPEDFAKDGIFPSKQQFIELFASLQKQAKSDVWLIGEPQYNHVENYHELKKILTTIE
jgi:sugar phosphate isomerase/epimerase